MNIELRNSPTKEKTFSNDLSVESIDEDKKINQQNSANKITVWQDIKNILLLILMYFYQGLIINFFAGTISIIFSQDIKDQETRSQALSLLSMQTLPFSFKFIWAPILDTYYSVKLGKRKSYIVPLQYTLVAVLFYVSTFINVAIAEQQVFKIFLFGFISIFCLTVQDIAVDSWSVTLLHEENVAYASFSQSFGQVIGNIVSFNIYIWLSSEDFCKQYLNLSKPVLEPFTMIYVMALLVLIGTIFIHFFQKEKSVKSTENITLVQSLQKLTFFAKNRNLLYLILFLLTCNIGFNCIEATAEYYLLAQNFRREKIATISFTLIPISIFSQFVGGWWSKKNKEFSIYLKLFFLRMLNGVFSYYIVTSYNGNDDEIIVYLYINSIISIFIGNLFFIAIASFFLRMCDQELGGTFLTFLNSFANLGRLWPTSFWLYLWEYLGLKFLLIFGLIYNLIFYPLWYKKLNSFENSNKEIWKLGQQINEQKFSL